MTTPDNQDPQVMSTTDAQAAFKEVDDAAQMIEDMLGPEQTRGERDAITAGVSRVVREDEVQKLRQRAQRERARGVENLGRRHDGVASVVDEVKINERVVASAFERFFAGIENGVHVITKRADLFVGEKNADQIQQTIVKKVEAMEQRIMQQLDQVKVPMELHSASEGFITPTYTAPAAVHKVQLRTKLAHRILKVFKKQDEFVVTLNALAWNDEVEADAIEQEEQQIKKEMRDLANFIGRTVRGMRNKVAPAKKAESSNDGVASEQLTEKAEAA